MKRASNLDFSLSFELTLSMAQSNILLSSAICLVTKGTQRGKFKLFETRHALLRENVLFLADDRAIPLPRSLGKAFSLRKVCIV